MFETLINALKATGIPVFHFHAHKKEAPYIVWAEDSGDALMADDSPTDQTFAGTIDYFTKTENDPSIFIIQNALTEAEIPWRLLSIQLEEETNLIHYEWGWELG